MKTFDPDAFMFLFLLWHTNCKILKMNFATRTAHGSAG